MRLEPLRLESLTVRGFMTAFAGKEVSIDFTQLPEGLIAFVGGNGEGKTTLLEAGPAGVYRQMLSREGDIKSYAMDRDSAIESRWSGGLRARLTVDGIKGGSSAVLERAGRPLNDGKVSTYDTAVAGVFPPLQVVKASAFAAQNKSGSFVRAAKKDRRDIFAAFLGVDRLVRMSETAKSAAAEVDKVRVRVTADVELLERETGDAVVALLERQAEALVEARTSAERRRDAVTTRVADIESRLALLSDQVAAHAAAQQRVGQLAAALRDARTALETHVAEDRAATTAEAEAVTHLQARYDAKRQDVATRDDRAATTDAEELRAIADGLAAKLTDIDAKLAGNATIQAMGDDIRAAVAALARWTPEAARLRAERDRLADAQAGLAARQAENERTIASFTKPQTELDRATDDAALLKHVPCGGRDAYAACDLLRNAKAAEARIADLEARLTGVAAAHETRTALLDEARTLKQDLVSIKARLADVEQQLQQAQRPAAYAEKLAGSDARVEELQGQRADAEREAAQRTREARGRHTTAAEQRSAERIALAQEHDAAMTDHEARAAARFVTAATKGEALARAVDHAETEHAAAVLALQDLLAGNQQASALQAELATLRADRDDAVTAIATAVSDAAAVAQRLATVHGQAERLTVLRGRLARLDTELLEWQLLQKALDRDGLPALEIDQAGPGISATANLILADCFASRFSLELVTQVARADGKGMKEEFTVLVTDNHAGDVRDIADLSGGEEVIVAEALMNAISIYVNERSATPMRTCFRDETTGALTKENTQRYIQMLRKVQQLGGFHQVLFISHDPDAYALADAQIHVAGGTATSMLPPYRTAA